MTILKVIELDLEGARQLKFTLGEGFTGRRTFRVLTDSAAHNEAEILAASVDGVSIPDPLDLFPGTTSTVCVGLDPQRDKKDATKWIVRVDYKSQLNQQEQNRATSVNPLDRATIITGDSRTVMVPKRRLLRTPAYQLWSEAGPGSGWTLREARNSAADPLDPPIEVPETWWELACSKNVSELPSWVLDTESPYANGVNDADQVIDINGLGERTIKKGCGKLSNLKFSALKKENGTAFITINWNVTVRPYRDVHAGETDRFSPWDEERLDEGMRTYDSAKRMWKNVREAGNQSVNLPVPFNGGGGPLAPSGTGITESDLWWYAYRPCPRVDYSIIPWS